MRLYELISTNVSKTNLDHTFNKFELNKAKRERGAYGDKDGNMPAGVGAHGYVEDDKEDEHMVLKKTHDPKQEVTDDGYLVYIEHVVENDLASDNPYFPRVYNYHTDIDSNGEFMPVFTMEKLIHFNKLPIEAYRGIMQKIFKEQDRRFDIIMYAEQNPTPDIFANSIARKIAKAVHNPIEIRDKMLIAALDEIRKLSVKNALPLDMHSGNFMIRTSKQGVQLVITDPLNTRH